MQIQEENRLIYLLSNRMKKLLSFSFMKIILFAEEPQDKRNLKHYDLQCQAISLLDGLFKQKIANLQIKAFYQIKNWKKGYQKHGLKSREMSKVNVQNDMYVNGSIPKMLSYTRLRTSYRSDQDYTQAYSEKYQQFAGQYWRKSYAEVQGYQETLNGLMDKVKAINSNVECPLSQNKSVSSLRCPKNQKRALILEKLTNIEKQMNNIVYRQEIISQASNGLKEQFQNRFQAPKIHVINPRRSYDIHL